MLSSMVLVLWAQLATAAPQAAPARASHSPVQCDDCERWNRPHPPIHVFGNTWWVGVDGLSAVAIDTGAGIILLDGALPQSVPHIEASLAEAKLQLGDVKLIGNSHAHFDHAGGIAALQKATGATVLASPSSAEALRSGCATRDDPQAGLGCEKFGFPRVTGPIRILRDGERVRLGDVVLTAHFTPGHTPGSTSWTWRSCEGNRCLDIVYADSLSAVSADGFRFTPRKARFEASIDKVAKLPCDILMTTHPDASDMFAHLAAFTSQPGAAVSPGQCAAYAAHARANLEKRLAQEK